MNRFVSLVRDDKIAFTPVNAQGKIRSFHKENDRNDESNHETRKLLYCSL